MDDAHELSRTPYRSTQRRRKPRCIEHWLCEGTVELIQPALDRPVQFDVNVGAERDCEPVVRADQYGGVLRDRWFVVDKPRPCRRDRLLGERRTGFCKDVVSATAEAVSEVVDL